MRILFDSKDPRFKTPFGTLQPGQICTVTIHIPARIQTRQVKLILCREDGREYADLFMEKSLFLDPYEHYSAKFALAEPGLFFYYFQIKTENESFSLYRQGFDQTNMEEGDLWQISCIPSDFFVPEMYFGKVMYQIFPDRFCRLGLSDTTGKLTPFSIHQDLAEIPNHRPNEKGEVENSDFFGGNLAGIQSKLDYLEQLGVKILYLNPIFKAWSNHRYDTADYHKIDELLGTEEDFMALCDAAHQKGIKIILDGVFSHTGSNSRYFDEKDIFGNGAYHHPDSPYRSWFDFKRYPDDYTSWWGIRTLPCVNEMDPGYLNYIIDGEDSVISHWLAAGADGFRLDVADELPDAFILRLRKRMKEIKPDSLLIGEVWEDASNKSSYGVRRSYFTAGELDSVMNYPFRQSIIEYVCERDYGFGFRDTVMNLAENYPPQVLHSAMNMLSTHDTPRLLSLLSPGPIPEDKDLRAGFRMTEKDRSVALSRFFCAVFLQFVLPGMPCIYYGDEIGTEGLEDPFCRGFFQWDQVDSNPILDLIQTLSRIRREENALQRGTLRVKTEGKGLLTLEREDENGILCATVNMGDSVMLHTRGEILLSKNAVPIAPQEIQIRKAGFLLEKVNF